MRYSVTVPDREYFDENIPCRAACPIHTECGRYVQAIGISKDEEAYLLARAPNPFAYVLGRICAHPCEDNCRRGKIDEPIAICALKRYATDRHREALRAHGPSTIHRLSFQGVACPQLALDLWDAAPEDVPSDAARATQNHVDHRKRQ